MAMTLPRPSIGAPAPIFALEDVYGNCWRLSDRVGSGTTNTRPVVVIFHRHIH